MEYYETIYTYILIHTNIIHTHTHTYIYMYMVFTTEGLFEVAIESWPEWDEFEPTITEFPSDALTD